MSKKLLLVLQTSPYDFEQAKELMKLIADLEPEYNHRADFMLAIRKDMSFPRAELEYISSKFAVHTFQMRNLVDGWPHGCNIMWMEAATHVAFKCKRGEWPYKVMLTFEPDCVPLRKGWIEELINEWERSQPATFVGHYVCPHKDGSVGKHPDTYYAHYNGNLMVATDFVDKVPNMRGPAMNSGWDMFFASYMIQLGRPSRLIYNDYRRHVPEFQDMSEEELFSPRQRPEGNPLHGEIIRPCFLHGCKKLSAIQHVRNRLLKPVSADTDAVEPERRRGGRPKKVLTQQ